MLKESVKCLGTVFVLLIGLYFVINIFPSIVSKYSGIDLNAMNEYVNEKREDISKKTGNSISDYIFANTDISLDRLRDNILKKASKSQEDSEKFNKFIKKHTGFDMDNAADKILSGLEDVTNGK